MTESKDKAAKAISEVASEWVARMHAADVPEADARAFMEWLRRSPQHVAEYLHAEKVFFVLEGAAREDATDIDTLLRGHDSSIVNLQRSDDTEPKRLAIESQPAVGKRRPRLIAAAAAPSSRRSRAGHCWPCTHGGLRTPLSLAPANSAASCSTMVRRSI